MKLKILRQVIRMSRFLFYGIFFQCLFVGLLLAKNTNGQNNKKSIYEINVTVEKETASLKSVLREIEDQTGFEFNFHKQVIARQAVSIDIKNGKLSSVLKEIAKQTGLSFKRVNENISVSNLHNSLNGVIEEAIDPVQVRISGQVTSEENEEMLPGVSILIKGTSIGTTTDFNGNYALEVSQGSILQFSFIGFETQEIEVSTQSIINVTLKQDLAQLEEIIVIGYGEKSRKLMTESIGTVNANELVKIPVASADQALQGRLSGVQITNTSGTPGAPTAIRIRGVGTVGNSQPLFVIDGIPIGKNVNDRLNPLASINPSDIESVSVLKDASAAAVYGVQAANGVVLITTKSGKQGAPKVSVDAYYGVQQLPEIFEMNNTSQYINLTQDAYNAYNTSLGLTPDDDSFLELHPDLQAGSRYLGINNNEAWLDDVTNDNAAIWNANASISGGTEKLSYFVSAGGFGQESMIGKWKVDRYNFRVNTTYQATNKLRIGTNMSLNYIEMLRGMSTGGDGFLLRNAATMPPFFEINENPDFPIPGNRYGFNGNEDVAGLTIGNQNGIDRLRDTYERTSRLLGSIFAELEIIQGLTFKTVNSIDLRLERDDSWRFPYTIAEVGLDRPTPERGDTRVENWTKVFTNTLNYQRSFGNHSFNVLAGNEYRPFKSWALAANSENFISLEPTYYIDVRNGQDGLRVQGGSAQGSYLSYFGRMSYDYNQKYLLTFTVRRDGTWKFSPEDNRNWGTFPSVSGAWRIGQEEFFKSIPVISDLKLRASWGQLGNDDTGFFPHVFQVGTYADYGLNGETTVSSAIPLNFVNRDVTWETVETVDFGFDASFFNEKVSLLATYYRRTTKDFLIDLPVPSLTGFRNTPANFGEVLNQGFEFELGYYNTFSNGITLDVSANLTTVENELVSIREGVTEFTSNAFYRTAVGQPIGYFYGYKTDGLYQTDAEAADALPDAGSQGAEAGDVRFVDTNGPAPADAPPGVLFSGEPDGEITPEDRTFLGKTIPDFYYGININATWRNFDLSVLFQGVSGVQVYNSIRRDMENLSGGGRNLLQTTQNRWTGTGTSNSMPRAISTDPNDNQRLSDRWIEDAGFLRLRNLQIGYTIPTTLAQKSKAFKSLRVYVSASNLFTITDYTGLDPEVYTFGQTEDQLEAGTDQGIMPQARIFQTGLQIQF